jgi:ABC-type bacteriocin/lantibiotic exporter with double-glycine peptidase domain
VILKAPRPDQRFLAHEVVQTSAMDCGPAALKSILEGFGISASYGRLREACQTDVDGTSIDTLEDIANQLGLQAEQVMLPADHLALPEAEALPAIVVVRLPNGLTHFLVVWGKVGNFLQVMDPATGRRWPSWKSFQNELYIHTFPVPVQAWREWAGSEGLLQPLRRRLLDLMLPVESVEALIHDASQEPDWRSLAALDAATRMVEALVRAHAFTTGKEAGSVLERFYRQNRSTSPPPEEGEAAGASALQIPAAYWSVQPIPGMPDHLLLKGAVLVRILGKQASSAAEAIEEPSQAPAEPLSPDLEAALKEPAYRPEREIWKALKDDGWLNPAAVSLALLAATIGVMVQALILQGILQISVSLTTISQRIAAMLILLAFLLALLLIEFPINTIIARMGRRLETRLRITFLEKLQRLGDRYFRSRLTSDMTQRAYDLRQLRSLPNLGFGLMRTAFQLILTALGVIWLDPISAPLAIAGTLFFFGLSFLTRPVLEERDLRLRTHIGALSRFYLDALLGLVPVKTHSAERAMRRQHEAQLYEWVRANRDYFNLASLVQSFGTLLYSVFAVLIVVNYLAKGGQPNEILLLFYWTLSLPTLGQTLANQIQQYPMLRNRVLRLLEPLGAPDEEDIWLQEAPSPESDQTTPADGGGSPQPLGVEMSGVYIQAGGHTILKDVNLKIEPGEHIAIVGLSGAGKSSLVGLLLGWHRPSQGTIKVDGEILDGKRVVSLRQETAWVDPAVQLWNRSLYDNLRYGIEIPDGTQMGAAIQTASLYGVLERLPDGLKTPLGEGGGLVSGGEGQRVRMGRAILRPGTRLAILDEPFRGLDRETRRKLLRESRQHWENVTLLCVTHDVSETLIFPRVLVIEDGQILEDGQPSELASLPGSRYQSLLLAEEDVRTGLWQGADWRRLTIADGHLEENVLAVKGADDEG